jgi:carbonic anhydrase/acetyltransferase-like protein (isoleucine patch superfamily)
MVQNRTGIFPFEALVPSIATDAFVAPNALLIGDIEVGPQASIWYGCILRGDVNKILIGARSNLQDGTIVHGSPNMNPTTIGNDVLVGHAALLHGCELRDGSFVGMRATILNKAVVETGALVAASALVTEGTLIPSGEIWGGSPARKMGPLSEKAAGAMRAAVKAYVDLAQRHAQIHRPS